jgi:hypothetical protein
MNDVFQRGAKVNYFGRCKGVECDKILNYNQT